MYIIFGSEKRSVFQKMCDMINEAGYKYRLGTGCYKGTNELSVMMHQTGEPEFQFIQDGLRIARATNQESILLVSDKGTGTLLYPEGDDFRTEDIGVIKQVSATQARTYQAYSNFGLNYFVFE